MNVISLGDALHWLTASGAAVLGSMLTSYLGEHWAWFQQKSAGFKRMAMPATSGLIGLAAWAAGEPAVGFSPSTYLWLVLLAVLPQLVAHSTYNWALGYLPAAVVSLGQLGEAVGSTLLAIGLLHEVPSTLRIAGGGLILVGIALGAFSARRATLTT